MTIEYGLEEIVASLNNYIQNNISNGITVEYQGTAINTDGVSDWIQVRVQRGRRMTQRKNARDYRSIKVDVWCYSKSATNLYRAAEIASEVRSLLRHRRIAIQDFETSGDPANGSLRLFEPKYDNTTRGFNNPVRSDVRQKKLTIMGISQKN